MSPLKRKKLKKLRIHIDKLDNKFLNLIAKRTKIVEKILLLKNSKKQIVDKRRTLLVLKNIKKKSIKRKIDPKITNKIWKSMIESYVDFQRRRFRKK